MKLRMKINCKLQQNNNCHYVDCKYNRLSTVEFSNTSCNNWFYHMCQNEYDNSKYNNEFNIMHNLIKRSKIYVDKLM